MNAGLLDIPDYVPPALHEPLEALSTERGRKWLWWVVGVLMALAFLAFLAVGANGPDDPSFADSALLHVTAAGGEVREFCVLVADTAEERARGLMERTNLDGREGMAFTFENDTDTGFWMRNTPMALTVAWFAADGAFVSSADMDPCADRADCHTYQPGGSYRLAVEVPRGKAAELALGPGSKARLGGACA